MKFGFLVLAVMAIALPSDAAVYASSQPTAIARVGTHVISSESALPNDRKVEDEFWSKHHRPPDALADGTELDSIRLTLEMQNIYKIMHEEIAEQLATKYGVAVLPAEIEKYCDANLSEAQMIDEQKMLAKKMKAVEAVLVDQRNSDEVFRQNSNGDLTRDQWDHLLFGWRSADWRKRIKESIAKSPADFREAIEAYDYRALAKSTLLHDRLLKIIDRELSKDDAKYALIAATINSRKGVRADDAENPVTYYEEKQTAWWARKAREIGVVALDPRFAKVIDTMLNP